MNAQNAVLVLGLALGCLCWSPVCSLAQSLPAEAEDAVKLTKAGLSESIILSKIKNDAAPCNLTSDQIIYLNGQGVSQNVITALMQSGNGNPPAISVPTPAPEPPPTINNGPAPTTMPPTGEEPPAVEGAAAATSAPAPTLAATPPPGEPAPTFDTFHTQLTPYGNWIQVSSGWAWQPNVPGGWRPYYDGGHWVYTDTGWYWQSDYPWGDVAFHYGRWSYLAGYGWVWTPGYDFAPAWVCWRAAEADGYCGWAPLPPGALFINGGWWFHGARCAAGFDFGLGAGFFTFVAFDHFWAPDFRAWVVPHDRVGFIFGRSVFDAGFRFDHGRFINAGFDRDRMAHWTGHDIRVEDAHAIRTAEFHAHVAERDHDMAVYHGGGRVDATRRMGEERPGGDHGHEGGDHPHGGDDRSHGDEHSAGGHGHGQDGH